MQVTSAMEEQDGETVVKRLSVPVGLEELMTGLTREVLKKKPKDVYTFASDHFAQLLALRDNGNFKKSPLKNVSYMSLENVDRRKVNGNLRQVKSLSGGSPKQLARQVSIRADSPTRKFGSRIKRSGTPKFDDNNNNDDKTKAKQAKNRPVAGRRPTPGSKGKYDNLETVKEDALKVVAKKQSITRKPTDRKNRTDSRSRDSKRSSSEESERSKKKSSVSKKPADENNKQSKEKEENKSEAKKEESNKFIPKSSSVEEATTGIKDGRLTVTPPKILKEAQTSPDQFDLPTTLVVPVVAASSLVDQENRSESKATENELSEDLRKDLKNDSETGEILTTSKEAQDSASSKYDPTVLREQLQQAEEEAKLNNFTTSYNPYKLRQEIRSVSNEASEQEEGNVKDTSLENKNNALAQEGSPHLGLTTGLQHSGELHDVLIPEEAGKDDDMKDQKALKEVQEINVTELNKAPLVSLHHSGELHDTVIPETKETEKHSMLEKIAVGTASVLASAGTAAATKIQSLWRGFNVRKNQKTKPKELVDQHTIQESAKTGNINDAAIMPVDTKAQDESQIDKVDENASTSNKISDEELQKTLVQLDNMPVPNESPDVGRHKREVSEEVTDAATKEGNVGADKLAKSKSVPAIQPEKLNVPLFSKSLSVTDSAISKTLDDEDDEKLRSLTEDTVSLGDQTEDLGIESELSSALQLESNKPSEEIKTGDVDGKIKEAVITEGKALGDDSKHADDLQDTAIPKQSQDKQKQSETDISNKTDGGEKESVQDKTPIEEDQKLTPKPSSAENKEPVISRVLPQLGLTSGLQHSGELHDILIPKEIEEGKETSTEDLALQHSGELHDLLIPKEGEKDGKILQENTELLATTETDKDDESIRSATVTLQHSGELHDILIPKEAEAKDETPLDNKESAASDLKQNGELDASSVLEKAQEGNHGLQKDNSTVQTTLQHTGELHDLLIPKETEESDKTLEENQSLTSPISKENAELLSTTKADKDDDQNKRLTPITLQHSGELHDTLIPKEAEVKNEILLASKPGDTKENGEQSAYSVLEKTEVSSQGLQKDNIVETALEHSGELHDHLIPKEVEELTLDNKELITDVKQNGEINSSSALKELEESGEDVQKDKSLAAAHLQHSGELHDLLIPKEAKEDNKIIEDKSKGAGVFEHDSSLVPEEIEKKATISAVSALQHSGELHDTLILKKAEEDKEILQEDKKVITDGSPQTEEMLGTEIDKHNKDLQKDEELQHDLMVPEEVAEKDTLLQNSQSTTPTLQQDTDVNETSTNKEMKENNEPLQNGIDATETLKHSGELHDLLIPKEKEETLQEDSTQNSNLRSPSAPDNTEETDNLINEQTIPLEHGSELHGVLMPKESEEKVDTVSQKEITLHDSVLLKEDNSKNKDLVESNLHHSSELHDLLIPKEDKEKEQSAEDASASIEKDKTVATQIEKNSQDSQKSKSSDEPTLQHSSELHDLLIPKEDEDKQQSAHDTTAETASSEQDKTVATQIDENSQDAQKSKTPEEPTLQHSSELHDLLIPKEADEMNQALEDSKSITLQQTQHDTSLAEDAEKEKTLEGKESDKKLEKDHKDVEEKNEEVQVDRKVATNLQQETQKTVKNLHKDKVSEEFQNSSVPKEGDEVKSKLGDGKDSVATILQQEEVDSDDQKLQNDKTLNVALSQESDVVSESMPKKIEEIKQDIQKGQDKKSLTLQHSGEMHDILIPTEKLVDEKTLPMPSEVEENYQQSQKSLISASPPHGKNTLDTLASIETENNLELTDNKTLEETQDLHDLLIPKEGDEKIKVQDKLATETDVQDASIAKVDDEIKSDNTDTHPNDAAANKQQQKSASLEHSSKVHDSLIPTESETPNTLKNAADLEAINIVENVEPLSTDLKRSTKENNKKEDVSLNQIAKHVPGTLAMTALQHSGELHDLVLPQNEVSDEQNGDKDSSNEKEQQIPEDDESNKTPSGVQGLQQDDASSSGLQHSGEFHDILIQHESELNEDSKQREAASKAESVETGTESTATEKAEEVHTTLEHTGELHDVLIPKENQNNEAFGKGTEAQTLDDSKLLPPNQVPNVEVAKDKFIEHNNTLYQSFSPSVLDKPLESETPLPDTEEMKTAASEARTATPQLDDDLHDVSKTNNETEYQPIDKLTVDKPFLNNKPSSPPLSALEAKIQPVTITQSPSQLSELAPADAVKESEGLENKSDPTQTNDSSASPKVQEEQNDDDVNNVEKDSSADNTEGKLSTDPAEELPEADSVSNVDEVIEQTNSKEIQKDKNDKGEKELEKTDITAADSLKDNDEKKKPDANLDTDSNQQNKESKLIPSPLETKKTGTSEEADKEKEDSQEIPNDQQGLNPPAENSNKLDEVSDHIIENNDKNNSKVPNEEISALEELEKQIVNESEISADKLGAGMSKKEDKVTNDTPAEINESVEKQSMQSLQAEPKNQNEIEAEKQLDQQSTEIPNKSEQTTHDQEQQKSSSSESKLEKNSETSEISHLHETDSKQAKDENSKVTKDVAKETDAADLTTAVDLNKPQDTLETEDIKDHKERSTNVVKDIDSLTSDSLCNHDEDIPSLHTELESSTKQLEKDKEELGIHDGVTDAIVNNAKGPESKSAKNQAVKGSDASDLQQPNIESAETEIKPAKDENLSEHPLEKPALNKIQNTMNENAAKEEEELSNDNLATKTLKNNNNDDETEAESTPGAHHENAEDDKVNEEPVKSFHISALRRDLEDREKQIEKSEHQVMDNASNSVEGIVKSSSPNDNNDTNIKSAGVDKDNKFDEKSTVDAVEPKGFDISKLRSELEEAEKQTTQDKDQDISKNEMQDNAKEDIEAGDTKEEITGEGEDLKKTLEIVDKGSEEQDKKEFDISKLHSELEEAGNSTEQDKDQDSTTAATQGNTKEDTKAGDTKEEIKGEDEDLKNTLKVVDKESEKQGKKEFDISKLRSELVKAEKVTEQDEDENITSTETQENAKEGIKAGDTKEEIKGEDEDLKKAPEVVGKESEEQDKKEFDILKLRSELQEAGKPTEQYKDQDITKTETQDNAKEGIKAGDTKEEIKKEDEDLKNTLEVVDKEFEEQDTKECDISKLRSELEEAGKPKPTEQDKDQDTTKTKTQHNAKEDIKAGDTKAEIKGQDEDLKNALEVVDKESEEQGKKEFDILKLRSELEEAGKPTEEDQDITKTQDNAKEDIKASDTKEEIKGEGEDVKNTLEVVDKESEEQDKKEFDISKLRSELDKAGKQTEESIDQDITKTETKDNAKEDIKAGDTKEGIKGEGEDLKKPVEVVDKEHEEQNKKEFVISKHRSELEEAVKPTEQAQDITKTETQDNAKEDIKARDTKEGIKGEGEDLKKPVEVVDKKDEEQDKKEFVISKHRSELEGAGNSTEQDKDITKTETKDNANEDIKAGDTKEGIKGEGEDLKKPVEVVDKEDEEQDKKEFVISKHRSELEEAGNSTEQDKDQDITKTEQQDNAKEDIKAGDTKEGIKGEGEDLKKPVEVVDKEAEEQDKKEFDISKLRSELEEAVKPTEQAPDITKTETQDNAKEDIKAGDTKEGINGEGEDLKKPVEVVNKEDEQQNKKEFDISKLRSELEEAGKPTEQDKDQEITETETQDNAKEGIKAGDAKEEISEEGEDINKSVEVVNKEDEQQDKKEFDISKLRSELEEAEKPTEQAQDMTKTETQDNAKEHIKSGDTKEGIKGKGEDLMNTLEVVDKEYEEQDKKEFGISKLGSELEDGEPTEQDKDQDITKTETQDSAKECIKAGETKKEIKGEGADLKEPVEVVDKEAEEQDKKEFDISKLRSELEEAGEPTEQDKDQDITKTETQDNAKEGIKAGDTKEEITGECEDLKKLVEALDKEAEEQDKKEFDMSKLRSELAEAGKQAEHDIDQDVFKSETKDNAEEKIKLEDSAEDEIKPEGEDLKNIQEGVDKESQKQDKEEFNISKLRSELEEAGKPTEKDKDQDTTKTETQDNTKEDIKAGDTKKEIKGDNEDIKSTPEVADKESEEQDKKEFDISKLRSELEEAGKPTEKDKDQDTTKTETQDNTKEDIKAGDTKKKLKGDNEDIKSTPEVADKESEEKDKKEFDFSKLRSELAETGKQTEHDIDQDVTKNETKDNAKENIKVEDSAEKEIKAGGDDLKNIREGGDKESQEQDKEEFDISKIRSELDKAGKQTEESIDQDVTQNNVKEEVKTVTNEDEDSAKQDKDEFDISKLRSELEEAGKPTEDKLQDNTKDEIKPEGKNLNNIQEVMGADPDKKVKSEFDMSKLGSGLQEAGNQADKDQDITKIVPQDTGKDRIKAEDLNITQEVMKKGISKEGNRELTDSDRTKPLTNDSEIKALDIHSNKIEEQTPVQDHHQNHENGNAYENTHNTEIEDIENQTEKMEKGTVVAPKDTVMDSHSTNISDEILAQEHVESSSPKTANINNDDENDNKSEVKSTVDSADPKANDISKLHSELEEAGKQTAESKDEEEKVQGPIKTKTEDMNKTQGTMDKESIEEDKKELTNDDSPTKTLTDNSKTGDHALKGHPQNPEDSKSNQEQDILDKESMKEDKSLQQNSKNDELEESGFNTSEDVDKQIGKGEAQTTQSTAMNALEKHSDKERAKSSSLNNANAHKAVLVQAEDGEDNKANGKSTKESPKAFDITKLRSDKQTEEDTNKESLKTGHEDKDKKHTKEDIKKSADTLEENQKNKKPDEKSSELENLEVEKVKDPAATSKNRTADTTKEEVDKLLSESNLPEHTETVAKEEEHQTNNTAEVKPVQGVDTTKGFDIAKLRSELQEAGNQKENADQKVTEDSAEMNSNQAEGVKNEDQVDITVDKEKSGLSTAGPADKLTLDGKEKDKSDEKISPSVFDISTLRVELDEIEKEIEKEDDKAHTEGSLLSEQKVEPDQQNKSVEESPNKQDFDISKLCLELKETGKQTEQNTNTNKTTGDIEHPEKEPEIPLLGQDMNILTNSKSSTPSNSAKFKSEHASTSESSPSHYENAPTRPATSDITPSIISNKNIQIPPDNVYKQVQESDLEQRSSEEFITPDGTKFKGEGNNEKRALNVHESDEKFITTEKPISKAEVSTPKATEILTINEGPIKENFASNLESDRMGKIDSETNSSKDEKLKEEEHERPVSITSTTSTDSTGTVIFLNTPQERDGGTKDNLEKSLPEALKTLEDQSGAPKETGNNDVDGKEANKEAPLSQEPEVIQVKTLPVEATPSGIHKKNQQQSNQDLPEDLKNITAEEHKESKASEKGSEPREHVPLNQQTSVQDNILNKTKLDNAITLLQDQDKNLKSQHTEDLTAQEENQQKVNNSVDIDDHIKNTLLQHIHDETSDKVLPEKPNIENVSSTVSSLDIAEKPQEESAQHISSGLKSQNRDKDDKTNLEKPTESKPPTSETEKQSANAETQPQESIITSDTDKKLEPKANTNAASLSENADEHIQEIQTKHDSSAPNSFLGKPEKTTTMNKGSVVIDPFKIATAPPLELLDDHNHHYLENKSEEKSHESLDTKTSDKYAKSDTEPGPLDKSNKSTIMSESRLLNSSELVEENLLKTDKLKESNSRNQSAQPTEHTQGLEKHETEGPLSTSTHPATFQLNQEHKALPKTELSAKDADQTISQKEVDSAQNTAEAISPRFHSDKDGPVTQALELVLDQQLALTAPRAAVEKQESVKSEGPEYIFIPLKDYNEPSSSGAVSGGLQHSGELHDSVIVPLSTSEAKEVKDLHLETNKQPVKEHDSKTDHAAALIHKDDATKYDLNEDDLSPRSYQEKDGTVTKALGVVLDQQLAITTPKAKVKPEQKKSELEGPEYIYIPLKDPNYPSTSMDDNLAAPHLKNEIQNFDDAAVKASSEATSEVDSKNSMIRPAAVEKEAVKEHFSNANEVQNLKLKNDSTEEKETAKLYHALVTPISSPTEYLKATSSIHDSVSPISAYRMEIPNYSRTTSRQSASSEPIAESGEFRLHSNPPTPTIGFQLHFSPSPTQNLDEIAGNASPISEEKANLAESPTPTHEDRSSQSESPPVVIQTTHISDNGLPLAVQLNQAPGAEILTSPTSNDAGASISTDGSTENAQAPGKGASTKDGASKYNAHFQTSMETSQRKNATIIEKKMEEVAATKIQASFRGYQVRKNLKLKNGGVESVRRSLRRKSSGKLRGSDKVSQKSSGKPSDLEEKSATKIQAGIRGFLVRRRQKKVPKNSATPESS